MIRKYIFITINVNHGQLGLEKKKVLFVVPRAVLTFRAWPV